MIASVGTADRMRYLHASRKVRSAPASVDPMYCLKDQWLIKDRAISIRTSLDKWFYKSLLAFIFDAVVCITRNICAYHGFQVTCEA